MKVKYILAIIMLEMVVIFGKLAYDNLNTINIYRYKAECLISKASSCNKLGIYFSSIAEPNYKEANKWFNISYKKYNNEISMFNLATFYIYGDGVEKDYKKAIELFEKSSKKGYALSSYTLSKLYKIGEGIEKNEEKEIYYLKLAAEQGDAKAQNNLAIYYMNDKMKDYPKAFEFFKKASEQNLGISKINLAKLYYDGLGVEKNTKKSIELLKSELSKGNVEAMAPFNLICEKEKELCK